MYSFPESEVFGFCAGDEPLSFRSVVETMKFNVYTEPEILRQSVQWQSACFVYISRNIQITGIGVWRMD